MQKKAKRLVNTKGLSKKEWLAWRRRGIGGSDASGIMSLNEWQSPLNVYIDKVEPIEENSELSEAAEWGIRQEPIIRDKFREEHPQWQVKQSYIMWQSVKYPFMIANVDGLVLDPDRGWGILEIKTSHEWRLGEWSEDTVPEPYLIQMMHYLAVLGLEWGVFAVLIGGNKYKEFPVKRDDELIQNLIELEKDFWNDHVLALNPPEADGSKGSENLLNALYPVSMVKDQAEVKELPSEALKLVKEYEAFHEQEKEAKAEKKAIQNKFKSMLGEYQVGKIVDLKAERELRVKWSESASNKIDQKKLEREQPEIFEKYVKKGKTRRFSISG